MTSSYILFIASWYPDEIDPTLGIFIRRHAEAVALYKHVKVLYLKTGSQFEIIRTISGNIEEIEVRYQNSIPKVSMYSAFMKSVRYLFREGYPEAIHAHVTLPAGFLSRIVSDKYKIPYGITEHWTGFLPRVGDYKGILSKLFTKYSTSKSSFISPVSEDLRDAMLGHGLIGNYRVIPNVAHPVFFEVSLKSPKKKFVHISSMDERQKNISGLLRSFKNLQAEDGSIELLMAGDGPELHKAKNYAKEFEIKNVSFPGNLEAKELADHLSESAGLILFSNFENLPCVIIESLACGTPVISTKVGGVHEMADASNSFLIPPKDESALTQAMKNMLLPGSFNKEEIRKNAFARFSYETVGKQYIDLYQSMIR